jgi:hypothetical protein
MQVTNLSKVIQRYNAWLKAVPPRPRRGNKKPSKR